MKIASDNKLTNKSGDCLTIKINSS